ncbi:MAG TPA: cytochrome c [Bryobacteraceae bacterium]|nr:cytochrome c [Bryobacteraceae bacterium]
MKKWLTAMLLVLAIVLMAQAPAGNPTRGKELFLKNGCYECHGTVGQGGTGPRLAPRTASLAYVRKPAGQMPPYTPKVMPDADLADVLAYLMSIPAPPPAKGIALLNQ